MFAVKHCHSMLYVWLYEGEYGNDDGSRCNGSKNGSNVFCDPHWMMARVRLNAKCTVCVFEMMAPLWNIQPYNRIPKCMCNVPCFCHTALNASEVIWSSLGLCSELDSFIHKIIHKHAHTLRVYRGDRRGKEWNRDREREVHMCSRIEFAWPSQNVCHTYTQTQPSSCRSSEAILRMRTPLTSMRDVITLLLWQ